MGESSDASGVLITSVLFVVLGCIVENGQSSFKLLAALPYTVVLFIVGISLNLIDIHAKGRVARNSIEGIDTEFILFVFLPLLIFSDSMRMNIHLVKGSFVQTVLLATTGVYLGALIMGSAVYYLLPLSFSWHLSMLCGAILSATDPVAVISLLKGCGASEKLTMLITGESILNDGTAIVLFKLYSDLYNGVTYTPRALAIFALRMLLGSPIFGFCCGLLTTYVMRRISRVTSEQDVIVQIAVTISCAYGTYFIADVVFKMSGVLAVWAAGIAFSRFAQPLVLSHESMHSVWSLLEWVSNTVIFLVAGAIFGETLLTAEIYQVGYLLLLYVILMLSRCAIVLVHYPIISRIGYGCSAEEGVFVCWSGLRGALCIVLALVVKEKLLADDKMGDALFFYVGGMALMTLAINATTAQSLLRSLKLVGAKIQHKELILSMMRNTMKKQLLKKFSAFQTKYSISDALFEEVKSYLSILRERDVVAGEEEDEDGNVTRDSSSHIEAISNRIHAWTAQALARPTLANPIVNQTINSLDATITLRTLFLNIVRAEYLTYVEQGKISRISYVAKFLLHSINVAIDDTPQGLLDWAILFDEISKDPFFLLRMIIVGGLDYYWPSYLLRVKPQIIRRSYYNSYIKKERQTLFMLYNFIEAHESAQTKLHSYLIGGESGVTRLNSIELVVIQESKEVVRRAKKVLAYINTVAAKGVKSKSLAQQILALEVKAVRSLESNGLLTRTDCDAYYTEILEDKALFERLRLKDQRSREEAEFMQAAVLPKFYNFEQFGQLYTCSGDEGNATAMESSRGMSTRSARHLSVDGERSMKARPRTLTNFFSEIFFDNSSSVKVRSRGGQVKETADYEITGDCNDTIIDLSLIHSEPDEDKDFTYRGSRAGDTATSTVTNVLHDGRPSRANSNGAATSQVPGVKMVRLTDMKGST